MHCGCDGVGGTEGECVNAEVTLDTSSCALVFESQSIKEFLK